MDQDEVVGAYLDLLDEQRRAIFARLADTDHTRLWHRPAEGKWSVGEHLDHTRLVLRSFRRFLQLLWPLLALIARLKRHHRYETTIDDVYERPGFPLQVGWMWTPRRTAQRPVPLATLERDLEAEHIAVRRFYADKDEALLGRARLWDPAIGCLNLIQTLRVGVYHDAHHFRLIEAQMRQWEEAPNFRTL